MWQLIYNLVVLNEEMASLPMGEEGRAQLAVVTVTRNWPSLSFDFLKATLKVHINDGNVTVSRQYCSKHQEKLKREP